MKVFLNILLLIFIHQVNGLDVLSVLSSLNKDTINALVNVYFGVNPKVDAAVTNLASALMTKDKTTIVEELKKELSVLNSEKIISGYSYDEESKIITLGVLNTAALKAAMKEKISDSLLNNIITQLNDSSITSGVTVVSGGYNLGKVDLNSLDSKIEQLKNVTLPPTNPIIIDVTSNTIIPPNVSLIYNIIGKNVIPPNVSAIYDTVGKTVIPPNNSVIYDIVGKTVIPPNVSAIYGMIMNATVPPQYTSGVKLADITLNDTVFDLNIPKPLVSVSVAEGDKLTFEEKLNFYKQWYADTVDKLRKANKSMDDPMTYRTAMFCYPGPNPIPYDSLSSTPTIISCTEIENIFTKVKQEADQLMKNISSPQDVAGLLKDSSKLKTNIEEIKAHLSQLSTVVSGSDASQKIENRIRLLEEYVNSLPTNSTSNSTAESYSGLKTFCSKYFQWSSSDFSTLVTKLS